jgi:hypothetical protein
VSQEGQCGIEARDELLRHGGRRIIEPAPHKRVERGPAPEIPTVRGQRRMHVISKPPRHVSERSDSEIERWAEEIVRGIREQLAREAPTSQQGPQDK